MMTKAEMLADGLALMAEWCAWNKFPVPAVRVAERADWFVGACGYYRSDVIHICPTLCAAIGVAGQAWSYPGYVIDRTPYGVVQHELGHHVDRTLSSDKAAYGGDFSENMRAESGEPKLTNYCPNDWEWFAEIFRLYVTNPDLCRLVRPRTFALICKAGLAPVRLRPWRDVLAGAPARTIEQASRKIRG